MSDNGNQCAPGKIALAVCAAIILFALTQIMKLSKPIEYGGDGT